MKKYHICIVLMLTMVLLASCGAKADEEKYQKLTEYRESLVEYYGKLEQQSMLSDNYDSLKTVIDSMYARKDMYKTKIDSAKAALERLKDDARRIRHEYFPTTTEDIAGDMKNIQMVLGEGFDWFEELTDSLEM